jgi:nitrogen fixation protein NifB
MTNESCQATAVENQNSTRPVVAVASLDGAQVNQHLGAAERVLIYQPHSEQPGTFLLREIRPAPLRGGGDARWQALAQLLADCRALLVTAGGAKPRAVIESHGVQIVLLEGAIETGLRAVYGNQPVPTELRRSCGNCHCGRR